MEVSNKIIAVLLVLAIGVSLTGTLVSLNKIGRYGFSITGMAVNTSTGVAQLTIGVITELTNQVPTIDWGNGFVNGSYTNCTMDSEGNLSGGCVGFSSQSSGFLLENTGNTLMSVNFTSDKNASVFINGTNPSFQLKVSPNSIEGQSGESSAQDTTPSCGNAWTPSSYTEVNLTGSYLCGNSTTYPFDYEGTKDATVVDLVVRVPENSPAGAKQVTITFTGVSP